MDKRAGAPALAGSASFMPRHRPYPVYRYVCLGPHPDARHRAVPVAHSPAGQCRSSSSGIGKSETFAVARAAPIPAADAATRQSAWWSMIPRSANSRRHRPARSASAARSGASRSALTRRRADGSSPDRSPRHISSTEIADTHGSTPTRLRLLTRPAAGRPGARRSERSSRAPAATCSTGPASVAASLRSDPPGGILIPLVSRVRNGPQGCFYVVPATLVIKTSFDQLGDEGAPTPRACPPVKIGYQCIVQLNV